MNEQEKQAYADFYGIDVALVHWCTICECWDHADADGWPQCPCV